MPGADVAGKINYLIGQIHPGDREYTHAEIAAGIAQKTGITVTPEYIGQLRAGKVTNPSMRTLAGLARFFGVPMDTFYDDDVARQVQREIELAVALRRASAYNLAARLPRLAPEQLDEVVALVNHYLGDEDEGGAHDDAGHTAPDLAPADEGAPTPADAGHPRGGQQRED